MAAQPLFNRRIQLRANVFAELVAWKLPRPVSGCQHRYKYRLALVKDSAGKGDHRHRNGRESGYHFTEIEQLIADFMADVTRCLHDDDNL
jgi:hypothetical protein